MAIAPDTFCAGFERRWGHLTRPHLRALAWLLDAPDLLDPASALWGGKIATLGPLAPGTADWLAQLERDPAPLDAALGARPYSRLGLYAEKLMAFYFEKQGMLLAHGLQVRASKNDTVGEFDFLLRERALLLHWEFATKFYLLDAGGDEGNLERLVGPNLSDTLAAKMRKILDRQLALARHPAAQGLLPQAVARAQALVKGWLFYPDGVVRPMPGIARLHCHGFWCAREQVGRLPADQFVILPRLQWLAPFKAQAGQAVLGRSVLESTLSARFAEAPAPVLVAAVREENGWVLEHDRGFIVPGDWAAQAALRRRSGTLPS